MTIQSFDESSPEPKWIKENPFAGNSKYIPIGILNLVTKSFQRI
jgi:hypothetical protein